MELDDDGVHTLAVAILVQACVDLLDVYAGSRHGRDPDEDRLAELRDFFYSDWGALVVQAAAQSRTEQEAHLVRYGASGQESAMDEAMQWDVGGKEVAIWRKGSKTARDLFHHIVYDRPFRKGLRNRLRKLGLIGGTFEEKVGYNV